MRIGISKATPKKRLAIRCRPGRIPLGGLVLLCLVVMVGPQALDGRGQNEPEWYASYSQAVEKIKTGEKDNAAPDNPIWRESIVLLESALMAETDPAREKQIGRKKEKYFPYYYLAIASLRTGDLKRARENFAKAEESGQLVGGRRFIVFGADESKELERYQAELHFREAEELFEREQFSAASEALETASGGNLSNALKRQVPAFENRIRTALATQRARFDSLIQEANAAAERDDLATAAARLDQAALLDEDEFVKRGLRMRREEIDRTVELLLRQAQNHVSTGQLSLAKQTLRRAQTILPSRKDVGDAIDRIAVRERSYRTALAAADAAANKNDVSTASNQYARAQTAHPEWALRDDLAGRIAALSRRIAALSRRNEARNKRNADPPRAPVSQPPKQRPVVERTPEPEPVPEAADDQIPALETALLAFKAWQMSPTDQELLEAARNQLVKLAEADFEAFQQEGRELLDEMNLCSRRHLRIGLTARSYSVTILRLRPANGDRGPRANARDRRYR